MNIIINLIFLVAGLYLVAGSLFAIFFISKGLEKVDKAAQGSGWGFRLIILPGTLILWPVLLKKWRNRNRKHD